MGARPEAVARSVNSAGKGGQTSSLQAEGESSNIQQQLKSLESSDPQAKQLPTPPPPRLTEPLPEATEPGMPTPPLSSCADGVALWNDAPTLDFAENLGNKDEQAVFSLWAVTGGCEPAFAYLLPLSREVPAPLAHTVGNNERTILVQQKQVPLQKELLVNTTVDDAQKTPALTACADPLVPVQDYKSYQRVELQ